MRFISKIIPFIIIPSVYISFFPGKIILITTICLFPFLLFYIKRFLFEKYSIRENADSINIIKLYMIYGFITFLRGVFTIQNIDDFSRLFGSSMYYFILFPLVMYYFNSYIFVNYIRSYVFYGIIAIILISINGTKSGNSDLPHMISGFYIIGLMLPYLRKKWWFIIMPIVLYVLITNLGTRINIINCIFFLFLLSSFYLKRLFFYRLSKTIAITFLIAPIILLLLGINTSVNFYR